MNIKIVDTIHKKAKAVIKTRDAKRIYFNDCLIALVCPVCGKGLTRVSTFFTSTYTCKKCGVIEKEQSSPSLYL